MVSGSVPGLLELLGSCSQQERKKCDEKENWCMKVAKKQTSSTATGNVDRPRVLKNNSDTTQIN